MTLLGLLHAVRRRWLLVCLMILVVELVVYSATKAREGWESDQFVSTGKLLMRPAGLSAYVTTLGSAVEVTPTRSRATELWFLDFKRARKIVESVDFLERVRKRLPPPQNSLSVDALRGQLLIFPSSLQLQTVAGFYEVAQFEGEEELEANLELQGLNDMIGRRRLRMITLSATSTSPEFAEHLARVALYEFLDEARRQASQEYTTRREILYEMLHNAEANAARVDKRLQADRTDPFFELWTAGFELEREKARLSVLEAQIAHDRNRLADLQHHLVAPEQLREDPVNQEILEAERQLKIDEEVFSSTSATLAETRARLLALRRARDERTQKAERAQAAELESRVRTNQRRWEQQVAEVAAAARRLGTSAEQKQINRWENETRHWQENISALVRQYYRVRVEERQAQAAGTLVIMEKPSLGTRIAQAPGDFNAPAALVALLPVGFFFGIVAAGLSEAFWHHRSPLRRLPRELGVPVLVTLPTLPSAQSKEWQTMKRSLPTRGND